MTSFSINTPKTGKPHTGSDERGIVMTIEGFTKGGQEEESTPCFVSKNTNPFSVTVECRGITVGK